MCNTQFFKKEKIQVNFHHSHIKITHIMNDKIHLWKVRSDNIAMIRQIYNMLCKCHIQLLYFCSKTFIYILPEGKNRPFQIYWWGFSSVFYTCKKEDPVKESFSLGTSSSGCTFIVAVLACSGRVFFSFSSSSFLHSSSRSSSFFFSL